MYKCLMLECSSCLPEQGLLWPGDKNSGLPNPEWSQLSDIKFGGKAGVSGQELATSNDDYDNTTNIIHGDQAGRSCKLLYLSGMEPLPMSDYTTSVSHTHHQLPNFR
jgi:hypothetical protein